jgi:hypothetical protein
MELPASINKFIERARGVVDGASNARAALDERIDRTSSDAAFAVAKTIETTRERVNDITDTAVAHAEALAERARESEDEFFNMASKRVVETVRENPASATAGALTFLALALPGPRALLWRSTLGRLQSEEALFNACVRRSETLALDAEAASGEIQRLTEAASAAEVEMKRGAANLKSAARELRAMESRTYGMDKKATTLLNDLRVLPSKEAVALQEQVASTVDKVAAHRNVALSTLKRIFKSGIEV